MADWSFIVEHYAGTSSSETVITDEVIAIPMFTDTGSGEVNEASLLLNAVDGQFIKSGVNSKDKIEQYDVIRIEDDTLRGDGRIQSEHDLWND